MTNGVIKFIKKLKNILTYRLLINKIKVRNKNKVFVIGFNKTGTTTLEKTLKEFDYILGNQMKAYRLMDDILNNKYESLYEYCKTGEAFQDIPFSRPEIYKLLDKKFPNSKFILTIRDDNEQWFNSMKKFHSKLFGKGNTPTKEDLLDDKIIYEGWRYKIQTDFYGKLLYNKKNYTDIYDKHILEVNNYFNFMENKLLIVNVSNDSDYIKLCTFLGVNPIGNSFPWENKTSKIEASK